MTRCLQCGEPNCGVCAYTEEPRDDCPVCRELPEERAAYVPSPEYAAWCAEVDALRAGKLGLTQVEHLGPGRIAA